MSIASTPYLIKPLLPGHTALCHVTATSSPTVWTEVYVTSVYSEGGREGETGEGEGKEEDLSHDIAGRGLWNAAFRPAMNKVLRKARDKVPASVTNVHFKFI